MTRETPRRRRRRLWIALAAVVLVLAAVIVPPMIGISRYKARIARLVSQSIGRPVHLSGVELRLLPWPSFVLSNFVVDENPAYGAEPILYADTVTTDVRLLALWRGRIEIGSIKVNSASLNLVRMPGGRWNLDPIFRTAAAKAGATIDGEPHKGNALRLPYLEATQSRINFKNGPEKLPFSIINADVSLWEESPGDWRIRLRGQPARTDVSLFQEDTGVVRLDASVRHAPALRDMPIRVDLDWREAQLGQLSRLLTGSDPGWRGNLTANLHLDGTPETTHVTARLRATGVHRAEFAPADALDFDANCAFVYHYSSRALQNLACDSPLGAGHLRLAGDLPGSGGEPHFTLALDRIPVNAGLAFLRTIREDIDSNLSASGSISGKMTYAGISPLTPARRRRTRPQAPAHANPPQPLTGSFALSGFRLSGGSLSNPIHAARVVIQPAEGGPGDAAALAFTATADVPFGAPVPLTFTPRLTVRGYQVGIHGEASLADAKQLAHLAGISQASALDALTGGPVSLNLSVQGPWLPPEPAELPPPQVIAPVQLAASADPDPPASSSDDLAGTVALHDAHWRPEFLARSVAISQATLHFADGHARWDPIAFSYGPLKATASVTLPTVCVADHRCPTHFEIQFGKLKAAELQSAILGAREQVSLFDSLIDRLHLSSAPDWPPLDGAIKAAALELGPIELLDPSAEIEINAGGAKITSLDARLLSGQVHASGTFTKPDTDQGRPAYSLRATFSNLSAPAVGKLLGMRLSGNPIDGGGKIDISGVTARELSATATGALHFDWRHGAITGLSESQHHGRAGVRIKPQAIPPQLAHFSRFTGEAKIADGVITIRNAQVDRGSTSHPVAAEFRFGDALNVTFTEPKDALASTRGAARQAK